MPKISTSSLKSNSLGSAKPTRPAAKPARGKEAASATPILAGSSQANAADSVTVSTAPKEEIKTRFLDFIIISSLFLIFFLCPMFFTTLTAQGMGFDKLLLFYFLVLLGTVAWICKGAVKGEISFRKTALDLPLLFVLITLIASTVMSVNRKESIIGSYGNSSRGLIAAIVFIMFYYFFINNINTRRLKVFFWAFISSGILIMAYTLLQFLGIFILPLNETHAAIFNPLGGVTGLTIYLIALLPLLITAASETKEIHPKLKKFPLILIKLFVVISVLANIVLLALLNKFTIWPIAILAVFILLIFFLAKIVSITNNNLIMPATVFFLLIIFLVSGNFRTLSRLNLPGEISLPLKTSWQIAKESFRANYFFGSGPANYYYSFSKYKPLEYNNTPLWNTRFDGASGMFFESIAALGSIGALAVILAILVALIFSILNLLKTKQGNLRPIVLGLLASSVSLLAFGAINFLDNALLLLFALIFSLSVGTAIVLRPEKLKEANFSFQTSARHSLPLAFFIIFISATVIVMFVIGVKVFLADYNAAQSIKIDSIDGKIEKLNRAVELAPYRDAYYIGLANNYIALANKIALTSGLNADVVKNINLAISSAKKAVEINPAKAVNNELLALIYENAAVYTKGGIIEYMKYLTDSYDKVIELDPNNPVPYFRLALINVARANVEQDQKEKTKYMSEAIKQYDLAISKKSTLSEAYYGKGIAYERLSNLNEAIEQVKSAVYNSNQNVDYIFELGRLYYNRGVSNAVLAPEPKSETTEEGEAVPPEPSGKKILRNTDINTAEQIFLQILQAVNNHANTQYSLALLYKTIGENDKAKIMVSQLLSTLQDEQQKDLVKKQFEGLY